jgi:hypothetical protein
MRSVGVRITVAIKMRADVFGRKPQNVRARQLGPYTRVDKANDGK